MDVFHADKALQADGGLLMLSEGDSDGTCTPDSPHACDARLYWYRAESRMGEIRACTMVRETDILARAARANESRHQTWSLCARS